MATRRLTLCFALIALAGSIVASAQQPDTDDEGQFKFRFVGPRVGNRIAAAAGVPGDPSTYYAGAASGGVWKSTDGGNHWKPIFDKERRSDRRSCGGAFGPQTVWAGTGEAWAIRDIDVMGNGIYKSTDAGKTWTNMGLPETGRIGRIVVHPSNPDIVFACVLGRMTGPQQERGVYPHHRWRPALGPRAVCQRKYRLLRPVDGPAESPHALRRHVAGRDAHLGRIQRRPGQRHLGFARRRSTKWNRIEEHGLPQSPLGKIDVAVAPTNSNRVFALIQTKDQGSLWRSDDGGEHWKAVNYQRALIGRAGYYIRLAVSPASDNEVLCRKQFLPPITRWRPELRREVPGAATRTTSGSIPPIRPLRDHR